MDIVESNCSELKANLRNNLELKALLNEPSAQLRAAQFEEDCELEMHYPIKGQVTDIDHSVPPYYEVTDADGAKLWVNSDVLSMTLDEESFAEETEWSD
jgi:hypothetical protein